MPPHDRETFEKAMNLLSLFCGCGGMDAGFEKAGFNTLLAYDRREPGLKSWRANREVGIAVNRDISKLTIEDIDNDYGGVFSPTGVIGGPPCQGFSLANRFGSLDDPRNALVSCFFDIALQLHERSPLSFIVMENVPAITGVRGGEILSVQKSKLLEAGFDVFERILDAQDYGVAQRRRRLFLVAVNESKADPAAWQFPKKNTIKRTVRDEIGRLPEPVFYDRKLRQDSIPFHPNHWCMTPKSPKFFSGELKEGFVEKRSFKTLSWDKPSFTASYGNREVHVHPNGHRRLSVYEAMRIQGFDERYLLHGSLSDQITQVSEAVPPPLAEAIANELKELITVSA